MASKHMQRGRACLRAIDRNIRLAKEASEKKSVPETIPQVEDETLDLISLSEIGKELGQLKEKHLTKKNERKLYSIRRPSEYERLCALQTAWNRRFVEEVQ
jgi:hypothetical protein